MQPSRSLLPFIAAFTINEEQSPHVRRGHFLKDWANVEHGVVRGMEPRGGAFQQKSDHVT